MADSLQRDAMAGGGVWCADEGCAHAVLVWGGASRGYTYIIDVGGGVYRQSSVVRGRGQPTD